MLQVVNCELLLYAYDTFLLIFQHKDITKIETALNKNFNMFCDWCVNNKLSFHFVEGKTRSILFCSKHKIKNSKPVNIQYNDIKIKQCYKVIYLSCIPNETLSGESLVIHVINKINSRLRFLYRENGFPNVPLHRLLCSEIIQPFFDYACNAYCPTSNKRLKTHLQAVQNKWKKI